MKRQNLIKFLHTLRNTKAVVIQLLKEYWLSLSVALVWFLYTILCQPHNWPAAIGAFASAFFFVSWLTGQYFRVRKQNKVDGSLQSIQSNITSLLEELDQKTKDIVGYMTGGDSFCYAYPLFNGGTPGYFDWGFINEGEHPLHDVSVQMYQVSGKKRITHKLDILYSRRSHYQGIRDIDNGSGAYNIFYTAKNASWTQQIRWILLGNEFAVANRVVKDGEPINKPLLLNISKNYPHELPLDSPWN